MDKLPPKYVSPPWRWKTKLGLRAASALFLLVLAGIGGSLATTPRIDFAVTMAIAFTPAIIADFAWDVAESICILKRKGHRGMHPGAIVGVDLLSWMGWVVICFFVGFSMFRDPEGWAERYIHHDMSDYSKPNWWVVSPEDQPLLEALKAKLRTMFAFSSLTAIVHFALFVIACYETNVRYRTPKSVYVTQALDSAGGNEPGEYHQLSSLSLLPRPEPTVSRFDRS